MELTLFCPTDLELIFQDQRNRGIELVPSLLERFERIGAYVRRIDPRSMTFEQRFHEYSKAIIPAVYKKYEVKRIFGTNRRSACWFGVEVPALLVKQTPDHVGDTYPHRRSPNTLATIHDFLKTSLAALTSSSQMQE